jgi:hypothetical protein
VYHELRPLEKRAEIFMREPTVHDINASARFIPLKHLRQPDISKPKVKSFSKELIVVCVLVLAIVLYFFLVKKS